MIPFRYAQVGSDLSATFDKSQHTPYEHRRPMGSGKTPFLDPIIMRTHDNFLGTGSRPDRGTNRSIHAIPNKEHADWVVYAPTPRQFLRVGHMDDFWQDKHLITQGRFQLGPFGGYSGY